MEYLMLSLVDYVMLFVMLSGSLLVGIYFGCIRKTPNTFDNYFLGGKNMGVFPVTMSLLAGSLSALTLLGIPAEVYLYGTQYSMMCVSWIIMGLVTYYVFLPVFFKLQLTSTFEYFEMRFDKVVRKLASSLYVLAMITSMPIMIYGPALAFNQVSGFNIQLTALTISFVCVIYTSIGGLKGVIWADTFQFCCTLCTLTTVLIMGTNSVGGFSSIWHKAKLGGRIEFFNMDPDPTVRSTFWSITIGTSVQWIYLAGINPSSIQRFLAVPTIKDAKMVLVLLVLISIVTKLISCFSGLIVYAKYFNCDPLKTNRIKSADQIIPYYVLDVASQVPGLSGLFVSGLLSTALSSLSTILNTLAGTIYKDFVAPLMPLDASEARANSIMKLIAVLAAIISTLLVFVMEHLGTIVQLALSFNGLFSGPLLALFLLGMLCPIVNSKGILSGTIGSLIVITTILIKSQMHIWNGTLKHLTKPLYVHGCNNTLIFNFTSNDESHSEEPFWIYKISFYYFGALGAVISIIIALLVSYVTKKGNKVRSVDLFSPCIHRFLRRPLTEHIKKEHSSDTLL